MKDYAIFEAQKRSMANPAGKRVYIDTFTFSVEPQANDTIELNNTVYRVIGRHWHKDSSVILMVKQLGGSVV